MRDRKKADPDGKGGGEEVGGVEQEETVFWLYWMRKESMLNKGEGYTVF